MPTPELPMRLPSFVRRCLLVTAVTSACGNSSKIPGDATTGGLDAAIDGSIDASIDAAADASTNPSGDAPIGPLTPDPADPTSLPCAGVLGFPGPGMIPTPTFATEMLVGDVDGDGQPDILYREAQRVGVARGNGNGTFQAPVVWMPPSQSSGFRIVQFDADGKPDLLYLSSSASTREIRVALNYGTNGFTATQTVYSSTTLGFDQVELVDVNGDGKNDLVGLAGTQVGVLLATGSTFSAPQLYTAGTSGYSFAMAVADLTGDGRPDIAVTNNTQATVSVLVNNGNGTYANRVTYPTPVGPWGIVLADANEDGALDVIVGTSTPSVGQISVLLNQGGGVLGAASSVPLAVWSSVPRILAAADVNGDGHIDIGTADWNGAGANLLFGTGTGQFGTALPYNFYAPASVAFADVQADGHIDMVVLGYTGVKVYPNRGTSNPFEERAWFDFGSPNVGDAALRMADLNGDGRLDLLAASDSSTMPVVATRLATTNGMFAAVTNYAMAIGALRSTLSDVDNNGRADLVLLGYGSGGAVQAVINNGDGTVSPVAPLMIAETQTEVAVADVDGDGIRDAVIGAVANGPNNPSSVRYFKGAGNGQFLSGTQVWTGTYLTGLAVGDLNGDGKRDLAIASYNNGHRQEVLLATGNGGFAAPIVTTATGGPLSHLFARDLDADGHLDVIGVELQNIVVMRGDGTGALSAPARTPVTTNATDAAFGDLDGDGHLDMVTGAAGFVGVLLGRGDGSFSPPRYFEAGTVTQVSVGDVDGDGRLDILVNGGGLNGAAAASVLYGRCL